MVTQKKSSRWRGKERAEPQKNGKDLAVEGTNQNGEKSRRKRETVAKKTFPLSKKKGAWPEEKKARSKEATPTSKNPTPSRDKAHEKEKRNVTSVARRNSSLQTSSGLYNVIKRH